MRPEIFHRVKEQARQLSSRGGEYATLYALVQENTANLGMSVMSAETEIQFIRRMNQHPGQVIKQLESPNGRFTYADTQID